MCDWARKTQLTRESFSPRSSSYDSMVLKVPTTPRNFLVHICAQITTRRTFKDWMYFGDGIEECQQSLRVSNEGLALSCTCWWLLQVASVALFPLLVVQTCLLDRCVGFLFEVFQ